MKKALGIAGCVALIVGVLPAADSLRPAGPVVPYPEGFRHWTHLGSVVGPPIDRMPAPRGLIHHLYANDKALEGGATGRFPEGAAFVADWFVLVEKDGSLVEGPRKSTNVMIKDARFTATGGWGFEDFEKDSREIRNVGGAAPNACYACHAKVQARDHVFSEVKGGKETIPR